jgi:site-specific DNA-methyltransferase (adenine-specific)
MLFRKPVEGKTVAGNLRKWKAGGLRRLFADRPLPDAIPSGRTPDREEVISDHPCLKPQQFMRVIVRALLPLGEGTVLDPFMGSGSTIAAAEAVGYASIGVELDSRYFHLAERAVPRLAALYSDFDGSELQMPGDYGPAEKQDEQQLPLVLAEGPASYHVRPKGRVGRNGRGR